MPLRIPLGWRRLVPLAYQAATSAAPGSTAEIWLNARAKSAATETTASRWPGWHSGNFGEVSTLNVGPWNRGGFPMLKVLSEDVRECYRRAEECARQAKAQLNPELRRDFLDLELRWLKLARSYEVSERVKTFSRSRS